MRPAQTFQGLAVLKVSIRDMFFALADVKKLSVHLEEKLQTSGHGLPAQETQAFIAASKPVNGALKEIFDSFAALPPQDKRLANDGRKAWESETAQKIMGIFETLKDSIAELAKKDTNNKVVLGWGHGAISAKSLNNNIIAYMAAESSGSERDRGAYFDTPFNGYSPTP